MSLTLHQDLDTLEQAVQAVTGVKADPGIIPPKETTTVATQIQDASLTDAEEVPNSTTEASVPSISTTDNEEEEEDDDEDDADGVDF